MRILIHKIHLWTLFWCSDFISRDIRGFWHDVNDYVWFSKKKKGGFAPPYFDFGWNLGRHQFLCPKMLKFEAFVLQNLVTCHRTKIYPHYLYHAKGHRSVPKSFALGHRRCPLVENSSHGVQQFTALFSSMVFPYKCASKLLFHEKDAHSTSRRLIKWNVNLTVADCIDAFLHETFVT